MARAVETDEGRVEGAAPEVVHDDEVAAGGDRPGLAVGELEARRRRLVDHPDDLEPGAPAGLEGEEALGAVRLGGHPQHGPLTARLAEAALDARRGLQGLAQRREEADEEVEQREETVAEPDRRPRCHARLGEQPLERAERRVSVLGRLDGREAVDDGAVDVGRDRREVVMGVPVGVEEGDHRVVAAVGVGDDRVGRPEVEAEVHGPQAGQRGRGASPPLPHGHRARSRISASSRSVSSTGLALVLLARRAAAVRAGRSESVTP